MYTWERAMLVDKEKSRKWMGEAWKIYTIMELISSPLQCSSADASIRPHQR